MANSIAEAMDIAYEYQLAGAKGTSPATSAPISVPRDEYDDRVSYYMGKGSTRADAEQAAELDFGVCPGMPTAQAAWSEGGI